MSVKRHPDLNFLRALTCRLGGVLYDTMGVGEDNGVTRHRRRLGITGSIQMLVLSRKTSERILIGPDIAITIVRIEGNQVRIGIEAPSDVTVLRSELATRPSAASTDMTRSEIEPGRSRLVRA